MRRQRARAFPGGAHILVHSDCRLGNDIPRHASARIARLLLLRARPSALPA